MTSSELDLDSIKSLIPLYLKGKLSETEREEVEKALQLHPALREELESWKEIDEAYLIIEKKLPQPGEEAYSKIAQKIREAQRLRWFGWFRLSPAISFTLITAQLVMIIALLVYFMSMRADYRTLAVPSLTERLPVRINVVFRENATEAEIRNLLLQVGGKIIDGPSLSRLYVIGIESAKDWENTLTTLKKSTVIEMAEKAYQ